MRVRVAIKNDMRYQIKHGFYLLYGIISALYIGVLMVCPSEHRGIVASIVILTDPAMLGTFFIGAIWLLEKDEGLHGYYLITPLRAAEYIAAKALSLAIISTLAANAILLIAIGPGADYLLLSASILIGAAAFTTIGLWVASFARSLNQYMLLAAPLETFIALPPILAAFGIAHPTLNLFPGMAVWQLIRRAIGFLDTPPVLPMFMVLLAWFFIGMQLTIRRVPNAMQSDAGGSI